MVQSISVTHRFDKAQLIFLNTSDIYKGEVLNRSHTDVSSMPGQAKKSIQRGDILLSEIRPANGRWVYIDFDADDYVVSTKLMVLRADQTKIDSRFLYLFLTSSEVSSRLQAIAEYRSGTFPQITFDQVAELEIELPSLTQQKAIVDILDSLDSKIRVNQQIASTLEQIAQTIFKSWFVDFDPVHAKARGEQPVGMDTETAALFPDAFEESELGLIPAGWLLKRVDAVADVLLGGTPSKSKSEYWDGDVAWINSGAVNEFRVLKPSAYITKLGHEKSSTKLLRPGTTVLAITGATLGQFSRVEIPTTANQSVIGLSGLGSYADEYIYLWVANNISDIIQKATGGAQQHINRNDVCEHLIVMPCDSILQNFTDMMRPLFVEMVVLLRQSMTLEELRDSLLPGLTSGDLEIPAELLEA